MSSSRRNTYCVFGCIDLGAHMHRFPHPERRKDMFEAWVAIVGDKLSYSSDPLRIYKNKLVCDQHFEPEDKFSTRRLVPTAVPSLFLNGLHQPVQITLKEQVISSEQANEAENPTEMITNADLGSAEVTVPTSISDNANVSPSSWPVILSEKANEAEKPTEMITKADLGSAEVTVPTSISDNANVSPSSPVCRICLRSGIAMSEDVDDTLAAFYDEQVCFDIYENGSLSYCLLCEHQLKRFYNFRQRCRRAHILLKSWNSDVLRPKRTMTQLYRLAPPSTIGVCTAKSNQTVYDYVWPNPNKPVQDLDFEPATETSDNYQPTERSLMVKPIDGNLFIKLEKESSATQQDGEICTDLKSYVQDFLKDGEDFQKENIRNEYGDIIFLDKLVDGSGKLVLKALKANNDLSDHTYEDDSSCNKSKVRPKKDKVKKKPKLTRVEKRIGYCKKKVSVFKEKILNLLENGEFQDIEDMGVKMSKEVFLKTLAQCSSATLRQSGVLTHNYEMSRVRKFLRRLLERFNPEYETMFHVEHLDTPQKKIEEFEARPHTKEYIESSYKCSICYRVFEVQGKLDIHMRKHDPKNNYACPICSMRFSRPILRTAHLREGHTYIYHCKLCPFKIYNTEGMQIHYRYHKGIVYPCPACQKVFSLKSNCDNHWREVHRVSNICAHCGHSYSTNKLQSHIELRHSDVDPEVLKQKPSVQCEDCDAAFYSLKALDCHRVRAHELITTDARSRRYQCFYCKICFESVEALYEHKRNADHRTDTPKKSSSHRTCPLCHEEVKVENRRSLFEHYKRLHPGAPYNWADGGPVFLCEQCGKACKGRAIYEAHMRQHTGERPYACSECGATFALRDQARAHVKRHTIPVVRRCARGVRAEPRFPCETCDRIFKSKSNMQRHQLTHTGEKPFQCPICEKRFTQASGVKLHVSTVHMGQRLPPRQRRKRELTRALTTSEALTTADALIKAEALMKAEALSPAVEDEVMLDNDGYEVVEEITTDSF